MAAREAIDSQLKGYLLHGVEPGYDFNNPRAARQAMLAAEFVVVVSAYADKSLLDYADVVLPIAPYAETSGTYINVNHDWQSFKGSMKPFGEARPAWKVYRVLGNLTHCEGFEYVSSEEVLDDIKTAFKMAHDLKAPLHIPEQMPENKALFYRVGEWPMYGIDAITRHAQALQESAAADTACIRVHPETAERLKLDEQATIAQGDIEITLPLKRDERVAPDAVCVANALPETVDLGHAFAPITIKR